ncbi:MAG: archease [Planctomycetota bacterium]|jgi:SHS2 domain-containing protein
MCGKTRRTGWQHYPHQADIGIRGFGATKEQAFEQTAVALTAVITNPAKVSPVEEVAVKCAAPDDELLLVDWLNGLLYEMDTRQMLFSRFEVRIDGGELAGRAWGEKIDVSKHDPVVEVKAATYTELSVRQDEKGVWTAQCIVDV